MSDTGPYFSRAILAVGTATADARGAALRDLGNAAPSTLQWKVEREVLTVVSSAMAVTWGPVWLGLSNRDLFK